MVIVSHCETQCAEIQYKDQMTFNNNLKNKNEAIQSRNGYIQHSLLCIMDMTWKYIGQGVNIDLYNFHK